MFTSITIIGIAKEGNHIKATTTVHYNQAAHIAVHQRYSTSTNNSENTTPA
jgi:hypothetical protein